MKMIAIGADHRGFALKKALLERKAGNLIDCGTFSADRADYPVLAASVCTKIQEGEAKLGILLCGTGIGMSIAANRYKGIYAALCMTPEAARRAKEDDNANILVIAADYCSVEQALQMIQAWLNAQFKEGRYRERLALIDALVQR